VIEIGIQVKITIITARSKKICAEALSGGAVRMHDVTTCAAEMSALFNVFLGRWVCLGAIDPLRSTSLIKHRTGQQERHNRQIITKRGEESPRYKMIFRRKKTGQPENSTDFYFFSGYDDILFNFFQCFFILGGTS